MNNAVEKFTDNHYVIKIPVKDDAALFFTKDSTGLKVYAYKWYSENGDLDHYTGKLLSFSFQNYVVQALNYKDGKITITGILQTEKSFFGIPITIAATSSKKNK